ncbi:MAG: flagellar biosynthetic protein FliR [Verrucomicrobia bacterium]|nr:flagellar biosynthetic protein FliR [Verrucomicrobiota bacterium]
MDLETWLTAHVQLFALVFFRILGLCLVAPIFANRAVPARLKAGLGFFMALMLMPLVIQAHPAQGRSWAAVPVLILEESSVGLLIGMVASLLFAATNLSGEILGRHMGFGMVQLIDPEFDDETSLVGQFENLVALMLFLAIGGHHIMLTALFDSFELIPIGGVRCDSSLAMEVVRVTGEVFPLAIRITAPAFVMLIMTTVVEGLVARFVPQMNILVIGLPLKIAVGLIGLAVCIPMFSSVFDKMLRTATGDIYTMLEHLR